MLFVGDDWAEDHHDVELVDDQGVVLIRRRLPEGIEGISAASHSVFATAQFAGWSTTAGTHRREPTSQVHAKIMGTTTTLCGVSALSWFKFWNLPFGSRFSERCPGCVTVFESHLAERDHHLRLRTSLR